MREGLQKFVQNVLVYYLLAVCIIEPSAVNNKTKLKL